MTKLKFIDNARITLKVNDDEVLYLKQNQLSDEIIDMISKQIYPGYDLILSLYISQSSMDPEHSISLISVCWDGTTVQRIHGRHTDNGNYEKLVTDFM